MPEAIWNGKAWVTDDGTVISTDPMAGDPVASHEPAEGDLVDALPAIGGTLGSLAAGSRALPTGLAGAALGGAAGEAARILTRAAQGSPDVPGMQAESPLGASWEAAKSIGSAGLAQAGMEGLGRGLGAAATPVAKQVYKSALRPIMSKARDYGMDKLVNEGFAQRVFPNKFGIPKAQRLLGQARNEVTQIAGQSSTPLSVVQAMREGLPPLIADARAASKVAGVADAVPQIRARAQQIANAHPTGRMTPTEMLAARRTADKFSRPAYAGAQRTGGRVTPDTEAAFAKSMGEGYNKVLRARLGEPFIQASERTKTRYGLLKSVEDAANRPQELANQLVMAGAGAAVGGATGAPNTGNTLGDAITGAMLARTVMSPTMRAGASFIAPGVMRASPRGLDLLTGGAGTSGMRDALMDLMASHEVNTERP